MLNWCKYTRRMRSHETIVWGSIFQNESIKNCGLQTNLFRFDGYMLLYKYSLIETTKRIWYIKMSANFDSKMIKMFDRQTIKLQLLYRTCMRTRKWISSCCIVCCIVFAGNVVTEMTFLAFWIHLKPDWLWIGCRQSWHPFYFSC